MITNFFNTNLNLISGDDYIIKDNFLFINLSSLNKFNGNTFIELTSATNIIGFPPLTVDSIIFNNTSFKLRYNINQINAPNLKLKNCSSASVTFILSSFLLNGIKNFSTENSILSGLSGITIPNILGKSLSSICLSSSIIKNGFNINDDTAPRYGAPVDYSFTNVNTFVNSITSNNGLIMYSRPNTSLLKFEIINPAFIDDASFVQILKYFIAQRITYSLNQYNLTSYSGNITFKNLTSINVSNYATWFNYLTSPFFNKLNYNLKIS